MVGSHNDNILIHRRRKYSVFPQARRPSVVNPCTCTARLCDCSQCSQPHVLLVLMPTSEPASRSALREARRVVIKAGTSVLTNEDGQVSLTRIGAITEQIAELINAGTEVILVSSGAVGMGKRVLRKQGRMMLSLNELHTHDEVAAGTRMDANLAGPRVLGMKASPSFNNLLHSSDRMRQYDSACAAAGQFELMKLYSSLFGQYDVTPSKILLTQHDFLDADRLEHVTYSVERLLSLGILPIINENDAVSGNTGYTQKDVFSDNDSLAGLCARSFNAEVVVMLTDVAGVYDRPPSDKEANFIGFYTEDEHKGDVKIGQKSVNGRGGMGAKIDAAVNAVKTGSKCNACIVADGHDLDAIRSTVGSHVPESGPKGTLFVTPGTQLYNIALAERSVEKVRLHVAQNMLRWKTVFYVCWLDFINTIMFEVTERNGFDPCNFSSRVAIS